MTDTPRKVDGLRVWAVEQACSCNGVHWADITTLAQDILDFIADNDEPVDLADAAAQGQA